MTNPPQATSRPSWQAKQAMHATVRKPNVLLTPRNTLTSNIDPSSIVELGALVYTLACSLCRDSSRSAAMITVCHRLALELGQNFCNMMKGCCWMQAQERPVRDRLVSSCLQSSCQVQTHLAGEDTDNTEQKLTSIVLSA